MPIPHKKICFLISPIGTYDSDVRKRVDQWSKLIYFPALKDKYTIIRADKISTPGKITSQILDHIIDSDLTIIDYTELNRNVMYEAAIRHITHKPFIQIIPVNQIIPFDIKDFRCIQYDQSDLAYPKKLRDELKKCIKEINTEGYKVPEILSQTFDLERIVSDPEKFVKLLKKHFLAKGGNHVQINEPYNTYVTSGSMASGTTLSASTVGTGALSGSIFSTPSSGVLRCPNCHFDNPSLQGLTASGYIFTCQNCGATFTHR